MKIINLKKAFVLSFLLASSYVIAQVGINTTTPNAQLEIKSSSETNPANTDGILIPKVDAFPSTNPGAAQQGMMVYLTTTSGSNPPGFYYWDNGTTTWMAVKGADGGTLDQAYDFGGPGVGRTIIANNGAVTISGTDGLVSTGFFGVGVLSPSGSGTRMVWNPRKAAFRAGFVDGNQWDDINIGNYSLAVGRNALATGVSSGAFGFNTRATNNYSFSFGNNTESSGSSSLAIGFNSVASGSSSLAVGNNSLASSTASIAFGNNTIASDLHAVAFGLSTQATNNNSVAFGESTEASGINSVAFGINSVASGSNSIAFGASSTATGIGSVAMGENSVASGPNSFAVGLNNISIGSHSSSFGYSTQANGYAATAFGYQSQANEQAATAFGNNSLASGINSTAFGGSTIASGVASTSFGNNTEASGDDATAFGENTLASNNGSTSFGFNTIASGSRATSFGSTTVADGTSSSSFGHNNTAYSFGETVLGIGSTDYTPSLNGNIRFRVANSTDRLFVIGNAIDSNNNNVVDIAERSDAMIVLKNGLTRLPSTTNALIDAADGKAVVTKEYLQNNSSGSLDQAYDFGGLGNGRTIIADNGAVTINGTDGLVSTGVYSLGTLAPSGAGVKMYWNPRKAAFRVGQVLNDYWDDFNIGERSIAFGINTRATGSISTAFGDSSFASGNGSTAFGSFTTASGIRSTAFGTQTNATNESTTAFGVQTSAIGVASVAFGQSILSSGDNSTAFGRGNMASGNISTSFGTSNTSSSYGEITIGIGATNYVPSVNGSSQFRSSNATDRLFTIGNAIDSNNNNSVDVSERSDALIVLKNGLTRLPSTTNAMIDAADGKTVVTKEWMQSNGWGLSGNSGTDANTNFLGTTDNVDLIFKRSNIFYGKLNNINLSIGFISLNNVTTGTGNTAFGNNTGRVLNSGVYNSFFGDAAGFNLTTGNQNTAIGHNSLVFTTTGDNNTAVGARSLRFNTTGIQNVAVGVVASNNNTTGSRNIAIGNGALQENTIGNDNVNIGNFAGLRNETSQRNVILGSFANDGNAVGTVTYTSTDNVMIGYASGRASRNTSGNVFIGYQSGFSELGNNKLYIENTSANNPLIYGEFDNDIIKINGQLRINDVATTNNEGVIKNANIFSHSTDNNLNLGNGGNQILLASRENVAETGGYFADGNSLVAWSPADGNRLIRFLDEDFWNDNNGNPFDNGAERAYIDPNGQYFQVSDANKKQNFEILKNSEQKIMALNGYRYEYKVNAEEIAKGDKTIISSGFLAQELRELIPEAVQINETGEYFVNYNAVIPHLVETIKSLNIKIEKLNTKAEQQEILNNEILNRLKEIEKK